MDEGVSPGSAYRVTLDNNENLVWTAENNQAKVEYDKDPETSFMYRFAIGSSACCRSRTNYRSCVGIGPKANIQAQQF